MKGVEVVEDEDFLSEKAKLRGELQKIPRIDLDKPLECGLSRREIAQMRKAGMDKPSFVPWAEWMGPKKLRNTHMLIAYLSASGYKNKEIAESLGMNQARISLLLSTEIIQEQIARIRAVEFDNVSRTRENLNRLAPLALRNIKDNLTDKGVPAKLRQSASEYVLDHNLGKAKQTVDVGGNLLDDIYSMLREEQAMKEIPAEVKGNRSKEDPLDAEFEEIPQEALDETKDTVEDPMSEEEKKLRSLGL